jgi:lipoprotein signal peptidase
LLYTQNSGVALSLFSPFLFLLKWWRIILCIYALSLVK